MTDALVIGAGAAGLVAARALTHAGRRLRVLEASGRIEERIFTTHDVLSGIPIALGAEFVHGQATETSRLLEEARPSIVLVAGTHRSRTGRIESMGSTWKRMSLVFKHLDPHRKADRLFDEHPGGKTLTGKRARARRFIEGFAAADTARISEKSLATQGHPADGAMEARRIVRGYGAFVEYLARDLHGDLRLNTVVRRIASTNEGVQVFDFNGAEHHARAAILAVPLTVLQDESLVVAPRGSS